MALYGRRTLPGLIDEIALQDPDRVWALVPKDEDSFERGELQTITFSALANGINRLARVLESTIGAGKDLDTVCYIGPSDIRNTLEAHLSLIDRTNCRLLLGAQDETNKSITKARNMRHEDMAPLDDLLSSEPVEAYPWDRPFDEVASLPFLVLHTSGTTGLPKPVEISHGLIATIDAQHNLSTVNDRSVTVTEWADRKVFTALPPFHSAGINFFGFSVFHGTKLVLGPSDRPPSVETIEHILQSRIAEAGVLPPSLLADVAAEPGLLEQLSTWSSVAFGGGPLPKEAGDSIWQHTKVLQILGSTESFNIPELVPGAVDEWPYHAYHPSLNINFRPHSENLHELVFRRDESALESQGAFWTFPEVDEYSMKDLYEPHPSKSDLWMYRGRLDDIVVLSNGEKFNPRSAEQAIARNSQVKSALIVGQGMMQPALLVEAQPNARLNSKRRFSEIKTALSECLADANGSLPAHAQIHSTHIKIVEPEQTFLRSSKGEIQRAPTVEKLQQIITQIYETANAASSFKANLDFSSEETLSASLLDLIASKFLDTDKLKVTDNIFCCGFDSLQALRLLRGIKGSLQDQHPDAAEKVSLRMLYKWPTVASLSCALTKTVGGCSPEACSSVNSHDEMQRLLDEYTSKIGELQLNRKPETPLGKSTVLLTGSTGSLGSYLLDPLLANPNVERVVCLNRSDDLLEQQKRSNAGRGLSADFSKAEFLKIDQTQERLGLSDDKYRELTESATHIVHNAWPVNFNLPLSAFQVQLDGCFRLMELANSAINRVSTVFVSSVGAANNWLSNHEGPVPEVQLTDSRVAEGMGYAQSKYLAELLFGVGSTRLNLPVTVCRVGQIAGPVLSTQGQWNLQEWFPSILQSSEALGKIPDSLAAMDRMDWIPVDVLGNVFVELLLNRSSTDPSLIRRHDSPMSDAGSISSHVSATDAREENQIVSSDLECTAVETLHLVNPQGIFWSDIVRSLTPHLSPSISVVPYTDWLSALRSVESDEESDSEGNSLQALKLLDFYTDIKDPRLKRPQFSTESAQSHSSTLRDLPAVSVNWIARWLQQLGQDGRAEEKLRTSL